MPKSVSAWNQPEFNRVLSDSRPLVFNHHTFLPSLPWVKATLPQSHYSHSLWAWGALVLIRSAKNCCDIWELCTAVTQVLAVLIVLLSTFVLLLFHSEVLEMPWGHLVSLGDICVSFYSRLKKIPNSMASVLSIGDWMCEGDRRIPEHGPQCQTVRALPPKNSHFQK